MKLYYQLPDFLITLLRLTIVVTAIHSGNAQATPIGSGLLGYWQFNNSGADASGNSRDVLVAGGAGFGSGLFDQALSLNGTQGMNAHRPIDDAVFNFGSRDFTIQLWVNFNNISSIETLIEKFGSISGPGWTLSHGVWKEQFYSPSVVLNSPTIAIHTGVWEQYVVRRGGSTFDLFLNNELIVTGSSALALPSSTNPLLIGARNAADGRNFTVNGLIDEVAIWDRALSNTDIASIWNNGAGQQLISSTSSIPEPSIWFLFATGCVALFSANYCRRRQTA